MIIRQIFAGLLALTLAAFGVGGGEPVASEGEFIVQVALETRDAVCMLSCEYMLDGEARGGQTVCNADGRTPLSGAASLVFDGVGFPEDADLSGFSLALFVWNEFDDGDIADMAAQAGACPVEPEIVIPAEYGATYRVVVSGDREGGYRAALVEKG